MSVTIPDGNYNGGTVTGGGGVNVDTSGNIGTWTWIISTNGSNTDIITGGSFNGIAKSSGNLDLTIGASIGVDAMLSFENAGDLDVADNLMGFVAGVDLDLDVGDDVLDAKIQVQRVVDVDGDFLSLSVARDWKRSTIDIIQELNTGQSGGSAQIIHGTIDASSLFNLEGTLTGADEFIFGGRSRGRINIGMLDGDLGCLPRRAGACPESIGMPPCHSGRRGSTGLIILSAHWIGMQ